MSVAIVFLPMVEGDDRESAAAESELLEDRRVTAFWDAERLVGSAWGVRDWGEKLPLVLAAIAPDDPWRELLVERSREPGPLWDIAYFYAAGTRWPPGSLPRESAWAKQFAFEHDEHGRAHGGFFRGTLEAAEVAWSSWAEQMAQGMEAVIP